MKYRIYQTCFFFFFFSFFYWGFIFCHVVVSKNWSDVSIRWRKYIKFHILDFEIRQNMNHGCVTPRFIIFQLFHDKHYHINVSSMCTKLDIYVFIVMSFLRNCIKKEIVLERNKQVFDLSRLHFFKSYKGNFFRVWLCIHPVYLSVRLNRERGYK